LNTGEEERAVIRGTKITYIPQEPLVALNPFFTIREHFVDRMLFSSKSRLGLREYLELRKQSEEVVGKALKYMRLARVPDPERVLDYYPMQLSGGMLQRVLIALALASDPRLLLADEPTTALDVITQLEILELLRRLQKELHLSIIYVTHDLGVAKTVSDRVIVMYGGHMVEAGLTGEVLLSPMHPYTRGLVEAIPKLVGGEPRGIEGGLPDYLDPPRGCRFHPRCPVAREICRKKRPPGFKVDGRLVYCWLYGDEG
ncbi:MAG: ABC transporter ATP-binding protein, partial [Candidatus Korarchaeota archaeon]|nr:ABC transporter ATP-binding protein [Candidatus Korarchaeota archaeon]